MPLAERFGMAQFDVYEVALDLVRAMRPVVERLRLSDRTLAAQLKNATSSIASNIAEGSRRVGKDRYHLWSIAAGSAKEVRSHLEVAVAWGDLDDVALASVGEPLDRILAMLWRLTHPKNLGVKNQNRTRVTQF
jgi:four helix bundle protein